MSRRRITLYIDRISAVEGLAGLEGLSERGLAVAIARRLEVMMRDQATALPPRGGAVATARGGQAASGGLVDGVARAVAEATMGALKR